MRVLAINGSPHEKGCTYTALQIAAKELENQGIGVEIVHIGTEPIRGCIGCNQCRKMKIASCAFNDDIVNQVIEKSRSVEGLILGSPVHFSGIAGSFKCFLDRFFFARALERVEYKVGMSIVTLRRSGGTAAFDQLNHYLTYANMVVPASHYWNVVHGTKAEEVYEDKEGVQIIRMAARNMAWLMKTIEGGGVARPEKEERVWTNFIR